MMMEVMKKGRKEGSRLHDIRFRRFPIYFRGIRLSIFQLGSMIVGLYDLLTHADPSFLRRAFVSGRAPA